MKTDKNKIILINSSLSYNHEAVANHVFPTTAVMLLATVLDKAGWNVQILDGNLSDIEDLKKTVQEQLTDDTLYVGFSVMTCQIPWAYEVSQHIKSIAPETPVVWGGVHATLFPEQTVEDSNVDIVVINEAISESILPLTQAIHGNTSLDNVPGICYKSGSDIIKTRASCLDCVEDVPFIDFSLMDHRHYAVDNFLWNYYPDNIPKVKNINYPIVSGLGCAHRCSFCINVILHRRYRKRSALEIVDRIEFLQKEYGANFIQFMDEDFLTSRSRTLEFLDLVEKRKLKFYYRAWLRVDYFRDNYIDVALARRLHKNGLTIAVMGAESGSKNTLDHLKKDITPDQIIRASETLKQTDVIPRFSFMVGLPGETEADLAETKILTEKLRADNPKTDTAIINYRPYPGSPLYNEIMQEHQLREPESLYEWSVMDTRKGYGYFSIDESNWIQNPKQVKELISV
jgi:radical SAM superfamily enzyme YgiQ (UPF0313 family)